MSKKDIKPVSRKSNVVVQDYENEVLIYDLAENKAFSLNEASALVWHLCDGSQTVSDLAQNLSKTFKSPVDENFVLLALEQLKRENLIENAEELSIDFSGLSRRELIRKVGFATLLALPVVASLIAPKAMQAASLRANGVTCTASTQCTSGCCAKNQDSTLTCSNTSVDADGSNCRDNCECASGCCGRVAAGNANFICTSTLEATGSPCRAGCECQSGTCSASQCT